MTGRSGSSGAAARAGARREGARARSGEWRRLSPASPSRGIRDLAAAEADYRRGLELSPNSAKGYAGLAAVLYETPARRDEVLEMLDRARKLDPLEPGYDVKKAVFLFYERGDLQGANELLVEVLREHPRYLPALMRLCELRPFGMGRQADGVLYCEQALAIDPLSLRRVCT